MKDFEGYFTLDGSVGLYSERDNDVYHSVFGAISEAYEKFIIPANLDCFFNDNKTADVLDICYGIGYNTKSFLNYFLQNILFEKFKKNIYPTTNNDTIYTNNSKEENFNKKLYNDTIHSNNICNESNLENYDNDKNYVSLNNSSINKNDKNNPTQIYSIFIKAIDINSTLMKLSPFIKCTDKVINNKKYRTGIDKVDELLSKKNDLKNIKSYKLLDEVNMILVMKLIDKFKNDIFSDDVIKILTAPKNSKFFDTRMINFAKFYLKYKYNLSSALNNLTFLHNIYYQYLSKSYKNTLKVLEKCEINIDFRCEDARKACDDNCERYDFIFLDAFSPSKVPTLWSEEFIRLLYNHANYNGLLFTYSKSAAIRHAMLNANFEVGKIYNIKDKKNIGTIASKNQNLIKYKLNAYDKGLINTLAGITYKDTNLNLTNIELINNRNFELENSTLQSSSSFIKNFKGDKNEI